MTLVTDISRAQGSLFGPPSELIHVDHFIEEARSISNASPAEALNRPQSCDQGSTVEAECSECITELKTTIESTWNNPMLSAHLYRIHDATISGVLGHTEGPVSRGRKRKRFSVENHSNFLDTQELQEKLETISLRCWSYNEDSALFMRTSKNSDLNALESVRKTGNGTLEQSISLDPTLEDSKAVISMTVYNRVPWMPTHLAPMSQHVMLTSQSLADFLRSISCDSSEMSAIDVEDHVGGHDNVPLNTEEAGLLLIEGCVYGDGRPGMDYAEKLMLHIAKMPERHRPTITKSPKSLNETSFNSLKVRVGQPYWMLHQGNCEHFVVVDQIRLIHRSDPRSGYPLITRATPILSELCKACSKVPAVLSVVGDIRLGESPCLLCGPCWRNMGPPEEEGVTVVPLV